MMDEIQHEHKRKLFKGLGVFIVILCLYFGVKFLAEIKSYQMIGSTQPSVITLSGHGEVDATPDIASVNFTVESGQATQSASSTEVNKKAKQIIDFLKSSGIAEKDVKTENYSSYPKYSNPEVCPMYITQGGIVPPCRAGESKIIGYTVSESMTVKIRKVDDTSKIIDGINKIGVTNMSGPNFTIDEPDALQAQARQKAIDDAQAKAKELAKELHVRLGRISSFNENGGGYPGPIMYAAKDSMAMGAAPAPAQIPTGQNTISSDVTITYEIH